MPHNGVKEPKQSSDAEQPDLSSDFMTLGWMGGVIKFEKHIITQHEPQRRTWMKNKGTGQFNGGARVELFLEAQKFRFEAPTIGMLESMYFPFRILRN